MSGAKKQDWGDYSPVLRAAFHHEKVTFSRKTNNEYIEIRNLSWLFAYQVHLHKLQD
ncbi:MAG: hypothetical protein IPN72_25515 [Saprospiraceae bacterium]|nr:hypothetical protein [Saprospiraceae bacterium]